MDNLNLGPEKDDGNIEYKWKLNNLTQNRIEELITQMNYRLIEGNGEAIYEIGVKDDGFPIGVTDELMKESIKNLEKISKNCNSKYSILSKKEVSKDKFVSEILIRRKNIKNNYIDLSIVVAGNVDAGKTSTIGVLISGKLDNGRGLSRVEVFNFKHEIESGRTSSIAQEILGYDSEGNVVNDSSVRKMSWPEIVRESSKIVSFYDLAGHEKYLRTTIYGFSSTYPDYAMILIGANMGITHMTREHISLCLSYKIPFFVIFTKIDIAPEDVYENNKKIFKKIIKSPGVRRISIEMKTEEDVILGAKNMINENIVPYLEISNTTGKNIDILKKFLNLLPQRNHLKKFENEPVEFTVDEKYNITGIGTVVSGVMLRGRVKIGDQLLIGPDKSGLYKNTQVKSIHYKRVNVDEAKSGSYVCFNIKKIAKAWVKRGMTIISSHDQPKTVWEFDAKTTILQSHHTTIRVGYEPNIHVNNISQACRIKSIKLISSKNDVENEEVLRAGDRAIVRFRFCYKPEYIKEGFRVVFRENKVRGIGLISKIYPTIINKKN